MGKVFVIDIARCSGCHNCQLACKDEHVGNDWTPYAKAQPMTGQFWIKVNETVHGTAPKVKIHYMPALCNHCEKAACMEACPSGAICRRDDGLVLINPAKCSGCKRCVKACPYDAIFFNDGLKIAQKCTGCAHLLDHGSTRPRCADVCPSGALQFGEEAELQPLLAGTAVLRPEAGLNPKVFYKNIPGRFIAGTVYDPKNEEIVEGARCHLSSGPKVWDVITDDFGDFWFNDLPAGSYDLTVTADGFAPKHFCSLETGRDLNLGDIPLEAD
jgi:tetrathionate reductase subunit B